MATIISYAVGQVQASRTFQNDAKAAEILRRYAEFIGCDPAATHREKLQFIVDAHLREIVRVGRQHYMEERATTAAVDAALLGLD